MKALERRGFTALHTVVAVTGFCYLYMEYFLTIDDPFAIVNHPWQPLVMAAHIVAAPVFVVFFGMILRSHTLPKIRRRERIHRRTGWTSLVSFSVMALSGYLLQVAVSPVLIATWSWTHIITGILFVAAYGVHFVLGWRIGRAQRRRIRERSAL